MRTFHCSALGLKTALLAVSLASTAAFADDNQYIINQTQTGMSLPGVAMPGGSDEVRAADGTTCRSSMAGSGAYLDSGIVGGGLNGGSETLSAYGRIVVPLGEKPTRLNCDRLYQLELQRLEVELQLLKRGLTTGSSTTASNDDSWANDASWTDDRK